MIPKIIHHCWPSGGPLTREFANYRMSFMRHNPEYGFRFWTCDDRKEYSMSVMSESLQSPESKLHYIYRSDLMRLEILYLYGGVYVDTDMECVRSFDKLLDTESFAGVSYGEGVIGTAVLGTVPGNTLFKYAAEAVVDNILKHDALGTLRCPPKISGPDFLKDKLDGVATKYPIDYFYPYHWNDREENKNREFPDSYAVHHWDGMAANGWAGLNGGIV